jgi:hypothetical protein
VLYLDGEEEWLDLSNEMVVWNKATRGGALSAGHFLSSECGKAGAGRGTRAKQRARLMKVVPGSQTLVVGLVMPFM